jgi:hypothetical protein
MSTHPTPEQIEADTLAWLDRAVIGLNLCPFAKSVRVKGQVRVVVSEATEPEALLAQLVEELQHLAAADPELTDTTLLVHPQVLVDFLDFNDFVDVADRALQQLALEGTLQIASFHPQFQFAGTAPDDISNYTNRSPWPTLHLIRESSIARAVQAFPEAEAIFERNIETLEAMGLDGWQKLFPELKDRSQ